MLLIAVCDDLQSDRLKISDYLKDYCIKKDYDMHIHSFESGEALVEHYINGNAFFDIVFLDIYMSGKNGIMIAKQIRNYDSDCKIIFTTTSTEHALESFEVFPYNYLTKPIAKASFDSVFEKAIESTETEKQKSLSVKAGSTIQTVLYKDILFIESNAKTLNIHTIKAKSFSCFSKLDDLQKQINDKRFLRCHKSFLVNMDYVSSVENNSFKLVDNTQISVTQRNFANIKKMFFDYILYRSKQ
jgi:DNA-binding LytR/AlgR family response regulator